MNVMKLYSNWAIFTGSFPTRKGVPADISACSPKAVQIMVILRGDFFDGDSPNRWRKRSRVAIREMILLHGFIKKTEKTSDRDLELAMTRKREVER